MYDIGIWVKGAVTLLLTWISSKLGLLAPIMCVLCAAMLMDFVTAWCAAKINGESINSKSCSKGILKKIGYLMGVACGLIVDWLIIILSEYTGILPGFQPMFGILVAIWLILNELVSILENLEKSGVSLPPFLSRIIQTLKIGIEKKGDADTGEGSIDE